MLSRCVVLGSLMVLATLVNPASVTADTLSGKIVDPQGLAVANATIRLLDRSGGERRRVTSAADGSYRFADIPAGSYVIQAEAANSALAASRAISVAGDQTLELALAIAANKAEVLVTASGTSQTITEIAKAADVVDAEQIDRRNVFQVSEAIRVVPGLLIRTLEGPGSFTTISVRGLRNHDTAILVDGMRFQDSGSPQNDATSFIEDLVTTDTDRVEVLRGSSSSLYGSSAMGGVINIVSRSGSGPTSGELRAEGGGLGLFRGVAGIGGGVADDRVGYSGSVSYLNIADGVRARSPYRNTSGQGMVRFTPRSGLSITGRFWGTSADLTATESPAFTPAVLANSRPGRVEPIPLPEDQLERFEQKLPFSAGNATYIPSQIDPDGNRLSSFFNGTGTLQHFVSDHTSYRIAYQVVDTRRGYRDGPLGPGSFDPPSRSTSHSDGRTGTLQARIDHQLGGNHSLTGGYEFIAEEYIEYSDTPSDDTRMDSISLQQHSHSLYGQDQVGLLGGRLQVTFAGRVQLFSLLQPDFSGVANNPYDDLIDTIETSNGVTVDAAVAYFLEASQTKLRAHGGNSYRAPSTYERFGGGGGFYYGDPRLEPERSVSIDGGIDQWLFNSKVQISATVFWTKLLDRITFDSSLPEPDPFGRPFGGYANGGEGSAKGVELSSSLSPSQATMARLSYTYADAESDAPTFGTDYYRIPGSVRHTFAASFTQFLTPRMNATVDLFARSGYNVTMFGAFGRLFEFQPTARAHVVFAYDILTGIGRKVQVYGKVENLFGARPYENGFVGPGRWAVAGVKFSY